MSLIVTLFPEEWGSNSTSRFLSSYTLLSPQLQTRKERNHPVMETEIQWIWMKTLHLPATRPLFATIIQDRSIELLFLSLEKLHKYSLFRRVTNFVQQRWWQNCGGKALTTRLSLAALTAFGFSMPETVLIMLPLYRFWFTQSWKWRCWWVDNISTQESWWGFGSSYCTDLPTQFRNKASSLRLRFCWLQVLKVQFVNSNLWKD